MTWTWLADALRTICIPFAAIVVAASLKVIISKDYGDIGQLFRFLGLITLNIAVAVGDYEGLGHSPHSWIALIGSTLGITLSAIGTAVLWWRSRHARVPLHLVP